jgi:glyoxylase-like metal-dependent hydrolase (beta-lactamase superfamily II)
MKKVCISLSVTKCYLIPTTKDQFILIDTGYADEWELFCRQLKRADININQISHLILTHHHDDHCGLLNPITQANPKIHVVMSNLTTNLLLAGKNDRTHGGGIINGKVNKCLSLKQLYLSLSLNKGIKKENNLLFPPYLLRENDISINGEQSLEEIGIPLPGKIITTPGHTTDSISILFSDGDCFIGDAAANFLQFAGTNYCVVYVQDLAEYYRSWEKVIDQGAKYIYPAHGKPFSIEKLVNNIGKNKASDIVLY